MSYVGTNKGGVAWAGGHDTMLLGGGGGDKLYGSNGHDRLYSKKGNDVLMGGAGKDAFVFDTKAGPKIVDTIKRFSTADDTIELSKTVFKALGGKGGLKKAEFHIGPEATSKKHHVIYDRDKKAIY